MASRTKITRRRARPGRTSARRATRRPAVPVAVPPSATAPAAVAAETAPPAAQAAADAPPAPAIAPGPGCLRGIKQGTTEAAAAMRAHNQWMTESGLGRRSRRRIEQLMTPDDYAAFLLAHRDARFTRRAAWDWVRGRGYDLGMNAIVGHRRRLRMRTAQVNQVAQLGYLYAEAARAYGAASAIDASASIAEQTMLQSLVGLLKPDKEETGFDPDRWQAILTAIGTGAKTRTTVEALRATAIDPVKTAGKGRRGRLTLPQIGERVRLAMGLDPTGLDLPPDCVAALSKVPRPGAPAGDPPADGPATPR